MWSSEGREFIRLVAVNDGPERSGNLAPERPGVERGELAFYGLADIPLPRSVGYFAESNVWTLSLRLPSGAVI